MQQTARQGKRDAARTAKKATIRRLAADQYSAIDSKRSHALTRVGRLLPLSPLRNGEGSGHAASAARGGAWRATADRRAVDHRTAGIEVDRQTPTIHRVAALDQRDAAQHGDDSP